MFRRTVRAQLQREQRERLTAINAQTQSHFLFNSLNSISSVMHESPERADRMIRQLAALIETAFADDDLEVELTRELELARRYLAIHAATDDLRVLWSVGETTARARVPRLFLQPIIENSLKHGAAQYGRGAIVIRTLQRNGQLVVMVSNRVEPTWPWAFQSSPRRDSGGIGLQIVRERLTALWGNRFDLQLKRHEQWGSTVTVTMPFETSRGSAFRCALFAPLARSRRKRSALVPASVMAALEDIRECVHTDVASADLLIATMASFLRLLIDCTAQKSIPVYRDLELASRYIELEECRRARQFHVDCVLDEAALSVVVPFLSTQRLVEFLLLQDRIDSGEPMIRISVTCDAALVSIRVDLGQPVPAGAKPMRLTRSRHDPSLRALYESCGSAVIEVLSDAAGPVCATLSLPAEPRVP